MDVTRLVTLVYISTLVLAFVIFDKTLKWIWSGADFLNEMALAGPITLTTALAAAGAVGLVLWLYRNKTIYGYLSEVIIELKKVTWPGMSETKRSTFLVIVFSILLSLFLAGTDQVWKRVTDMILSVGT